MGATPGAVIDVSIQEALATLAMTELARAGLTGKSWSRKRLADGNGATVCILPARDGYVAISPRERPSMGVLAGSDGIARMGAVIRASFTSTTASPIGTRCTR